MYDCSTVVHATLRLLDGNRKPVHYTNDHIIFIRFTCRNCRNISTYCLKIGTKKTTNIFTTKIGTKNTAKHEETDDMTDVQPDGQKLLQLIFLTISHATRCNDDYTRLTLATETTSDYTVGYT